MGKRLFKLLGSVLVIALITSCGNSSSHRQSQRAANEADLNAAMNDLKAAEADYTGIMHMNKSNQDFDVTMTIKRVIENVRPSQPQDITQTVSVPKLNGSMRFPVLDRLSQTDINNYSEITNPMGGFSTVLFDFGDYDPNTKLLILPYNVNGYSQGNFGELQGELHNGVFTGTWFAKPLGVVGTFQFTQNTSSSSENQ